MIIEHKTLKYTTKESYAFEDMSDAIFKFVTDSKVKNGILTVQSMHTTAAIIVNENEPLLLEDMKNNFRDIARKDAYYGHNDFEVRTVNMCGEECRNGHSHCLAAYLPTSVVLNVVNGKVDFGQWQRIFLIELDHARERKVSVQVLGQ